MFADLPPLDPGIEIVVATRGMSKGISQTDGPQLVAKGSLHLDDLQFGAQWKNVSSKSANGEAAVFANASHKFGSLQLSAGVAYKFQTRVRGKTDSDSIELSAAASRKFGSVTGRLNVICSPDDLGSARRSLFVEAGPAVQLAPGWIASAAIGRRSRIQGSDYTAFNAGVSRSIRSLQLDLRFYDTDRSELGSPYRKRIVGSARLTF